MGYDQSGLQVAITPTPDYSLPQPEDRSASLPELDNSAGRSSSLPELDRGRTHSSVSYFHNSAHSPGLHSTFGLSDKAVIEPVRRQHICGITPLWYSIIVASVTAIIVGVAVGVGVGSHLSQERLQSNCTGPSPTSQATQTVTATVAGSLAAASTTVGGYYVDYVPPRPTLVATVPDACPVFGGQNYTAAHGSVFSRNCSGGWVKGDLASIWAYSHADCIDACEAINQRNNTAKCTKIQWDRKMKDNVGFYGNCYLKSDDAGEQGRVDGQISARLLSSP
jgi:hypothetical protein